MDGSSPTDKDGQAVPETAPNAVSAPTDGGFPQPPAVAPSPDLPESISWTASEFIEHNKSAGWYVAFIGGACVLAVAIFLLTHDVVGSSVIAIVGICLAVYGSRKPRELHYELNATGLTIADRQLPFTNFRSFTVHDDGNFISIVFMPLKRFGQLITIYVDPNDEDTIINLLANSLPMEDRGGDVIDQLMKRLRF